jgi:hypothetical protein
MICQWNYETCIWLQEIRRLWTAGFTKHWWKEEMGVSALNPEVHLATLPRPATFVKRSFGFVHWHAWCALQKKLVPPHIAAPSPVSSLARFANRCGTTGFWCHFFPNFYPLAWCQFIPFVAIWLFFAKRKFIARPASPCAALLLGGGTGLAPTAMSPLGIFHCGPTPSEFSP